jgi:fructosamine-3-kinase
VLEVTVAGGRRFVAKLNDARQVGLFEEEAAGLEALSRTQTVLVPEPLAALAEGSASVLLMTAITPGRAGGDTWRRFGRELAALHAVEAPSGNRYGFDMDNHCGMTPQPNPWCDDWVTFNAEHRIGHQLRLAAGRGLLNKNEARRLEQLIDRLDRVIPRRPKPALLHGDLWSGNALPAEDEGAERIAVIDPACSYGDGWADIAMMKLFGGFSSACFEAYAAETHDRDGVDDRIAVYQLYHVLNHVNLFGRGYAGQAMSLVSSLGA